MLNLTIKRVALRTLLLLASILAVTQAAYAWEFINGNKIYLRPGDWNTGDAWFGIKFRGENKTAAIVLEQDSENPELWVGIIPPGQFHHFEARRMTKVTPKTSDNVLNASEVKGENNGYWNSTGDKDAPSDSENNCIKITGWSEFAWEKIAVSSASSFTNVKIFGQIGTEEWNNDNMGNVNTYLTANGDGTFSYPVENLSGQKYFGLYTNENKFLIPIDNSSSTARALTVDGVAYKESSSRGDDDTFYYNFDSSKKYIITVDGNKGKISIREDNGTTPGPDGKKTVKLNGLDSKWGGDNYRTATYDEATGKYILKYTCELTTNTTGVADEVVHFRVKVDNNEYTPGEGQDLIIALGNARPFSTIGGSGSWWFYACKGGVYTITVDADASPMTVQIVQDECTHNPPHNVVTFTGLAHMWNIADYKRAPKDENGAYSYTHTAVQEEVWFRTRINGREYTPGTATDITSLLGTPIEIGDNRVTEPEQGQSAGYWYFKSAIGQRYTFIVSADGKTVTVYNAGDAPITNLAIPVVPARVKDRTSKTEWEKVTEDEPAVYLLSQVLNGEQPSNEWEMIKGSDGLYHLDGFTMRNTYIKQWGNPENHEYGAYVRVYTSKDDNNTNKVGYKTVKPVYGNDWDYEGEQTPGKMYNATYNHATKELTFEDVNDTWEYTKDGKLYNAPPYMALIGYNFQQYGQNYETPRGKHTNEGWQESRIQFDENANVMYDTKRRVMYSTMYPPKNPTYFYLNVNGNIRELRTRNLRMNVFTDGGSKMVVKTGKEWKEFFTKDGVLDPAYANLFNDSFNGGGYPNNQRLRDNDLYARYIVEDVWVLGTIKMWTGWTGTSVNSGTGAANWSNHLSWGYGANYDNEGGATIQLNRPYQMSTVATGNDKRSGNFRAENPTYFKSVELFYALDHNNEGDIRKAAIDYSILYNVQGYGEPTIDAKTDSEHTYATYQLNVANIPEGAKVTEYNVVRYNAATNEPCDGEGKTVSKDSEDAIVLKRKEDIEATQINDKFNNVYVFDTADTEDHKLTSGKYYYRLNIKFLTGDGITRDESVMSPIVTIVNAVATTDPRAYQLMLNLDANIKDPDGKQYKYVTFSERYDNVYGCQFEFSGNGETATAGSLHYEPIKFADQKDKQAYYMDGERSQWTNKVLIFCEEPSMLKKMEENTDYDLSGYTLSTTGFTLLFEQKKREYKEDGSGTAKYEYAHNSYAAVVTFDDYNFHTFQVIPSYKIHADKDWIDGKYEANEARFSYTFPVPTPGQETFSVVPSEDTKSGFMVNCPQHEGKAAFDNEYEHTLNVSVPMGLMNVDPEIRSDVYALLDTQVETVVKEEKEAYTLKVGNRVENVDNAIVLTNLDPNDWFTVENNVVKVNDQNRLRIRSEYRNDVKGYPEDEQWVLKYLVPTQEIVAPALSAPKVYRGIAKTGDNEYRQQLVLVSATMDNQNPSMAGDALMHHDDMHLLVKYNDAHLASKASEEDPMHRLSHLTSADHHCVLEESAPFHWYAEMDEAELVGTGDKKIETAYAYFFTPGKDVEGQGAMQIAPATAAMTLAADETPATHYMFVSPYSVAPAITDIMTSVDEVEAAKAAVFTGKGWIEVNANNATVYDAEGIAVAGAGRTAVEPGVYVVRADGKTYKVVVK